MATTVENLEGLERKAILSINVDEINSRVATKLKSIQKKARIDGFRPGKAPFSMIENIYGASTQNDVLNDVAVDTFSKVAAEEKWKVAALQKLTVEDNQDDEKVLKIAAIFETFPEVKVGDLSNTEIEKVVAEITDADIEKTIEVIRKQRVRYEYVDRAAQNGDRVIIKFEGKIDGTPFNGGSADNYPFVLGEGRMLPEFEQGVIGLKEKETKDVSVTFPEDYHGKDVAGKTAIFTHGHLGKKTSVVQDMAGLLRIVPDYVFMGHYHKAEEHSFQGSKVYVNGSIVGTEQYAFSQRLFSQPEQKLLIFEKDNVTDITIKVR